MEVFSFYEYVWPGLGLFLLYVFVPPLIVLATFRQRALPNIVSYDFDVELPGEVAEYFYDCHEVLVKLGFENVGTFSLPNQMDNVKAVLVMFSNRQQRTSAMSVVMFAEVLGDWKLQTKYTEFSTTLSGDGFVDTMNSTQVGAFPLPEGSIKTQHPSIQDLSVLNAAHQAMVGFHFPASERLRDCTRSFMVTLSGIWRPASQQNLRRHENVATCDSSVTMWSNSGRRLGKIRI